MQRSIPPPTRELDHPLSPSRGRLEEDAVRLIALLDGLDVRGPCHGRSGGHEGPVERRRRLASTLEVHVSHGQAVLHRA